MSFYEDAKSFWEGRDDPLHRSSSAEHLDFYAKELELLFQGQTFKKVLDLGCGNGVFFERLKFNKAELFTGVDFSSSMLESFSLSYPGAKLHCQEASSYFDDNKYDLIFSNSVTQHFSLQMFENHVRNAKQMLEPHGVLISASMPWLPLKIPYLSEEASIDPHRASFLKGLLGLLLNSAKDNGRWFTCKEVARIAKRNGFVSQFFGSLHYPYRMHAVLHVVK